MKAYKIAMLLLVIYSAVTLLWFAWANLYGTLNAATAGADMGFFFTHLIALIASALLLAFLEDKP